LRLDLAALIFVVIDHHPDMALGATVPVRLRRLSRRIRGHTDKFFPARMPGGAVFGVTAGALYAVAGLNRWLR
jgi:hypothetical protein